MTDTVTEAKLGGECTPGIAEKASRWSKANRWIARIDAYDIATVVLIAALVVLALCTFKDYAISNDESVQHHYGELIIAYYASGLTAQDVFSFQNLYLYGGLFDIAAILLSHLIPIDPYDLRHILCALIGIGGVGAAAGRGSARGPDRRGRPQRLRRVVRQHVQPHQGYSVRRRDDRRVLVP